MSEMIVTESGERFFGGLLVPEVRPTDVVSWAEAGKPMLDDADIRKILRDPNRMPKRVRFPAAKFIRRQINNGCNGFAGAAAFTRARILGGHDPVILSGDGLYAQISGNRDGGSMLNDGMRTIQSSGIPPEDLVKVGIFRSSDLSPAARQAMPRFRGHELYRVDSERELLSGLALDHIGVVAVHVADAYQRLDSRGVRGATGGPGNHAVCVQDVREGEGWEFDEVGSWGRSNGQDGHAWITWERSLRSTVRNHAFYLIPASLSDPQGDNPPPVVG